MPGRELSTAAPIHGKQQEFVGEEDMARAVEEAHKGVEGEGLQVLMEVVFRYNEAVVRGHFIYPEKNAEPNAHAEVDATLSEFCRGLNQIELPDCEISASREPCPMCFSTVQLVIKRPVPGVKTKATTATALRDFILNALKATAAALDKFSKDEGEISGHDLVQGSHG
ncbi:guanosine deaminase-like [Eucalyptus grandis]|uniref:guanosine deaminase-like n=1 Tax=Eucalyptus grandis TaxID=71139 RepID=UPI00192ED396|nr:guanosine deaminase-like [Eucalyptus grandis]